MNKLRVKIGSSSRSCLGNIYFAFTCWCATALFLPVFFGLVEREGCVHCIKGKSPLLNERFELSIVNECCNLTKDFDLFLSSHTGEQGTGYVFTLNFEASDKRGGSIMRGEGWDFDHLPLASGPGKGMINS